jgi:hypothetical protein
MVACEDEGIAADTAASTAVVARSSSLVFIVFIRG